MSLHTINSAALGATARDLAVAFPLRCLVPAVALVAVGILCRRLLKKSHPSVYGEDGLKLRDVTVAGVLAGVGVGAVMLLPLHFSSTIIISAALFSLLAGFIAWGAREPYSAVCMVVGVMMAGVGAVQAALVLADAAWAPISHSTAEAPGFATMWLLYALPGLVASGIAVALSRMPATDPSAPAEPSATSAPSAPTAPTVPSGTPQSRRSWAAA
ncbi:hypothetical protein [Corynebacterium sp.]|uniref:hypothetical protein n=1 Tax=Corynebacterium sp. TaxID=1720 RepID=UPI0027B9BBD2|nr:hypothetical protein [Corynebacterium sp.]